MAELTPSEYWNAKYDTDEYIYTTEVNRFVKQFCEDLTPGKVIDVAGGEGRNSVWFAEHGWTAENVDPSPIGLQKFLKLAAERGVAERCIANEAMGANFKASIAPADLGCIAYLQIPMAALSDSITNTVNQIRPGGKLFGVWHARENLVDGFGGPQNPDLLPTAAIIRDMLEELPVEIEICQNFDGQVKTKDGLKPSITLVLLATKLD